jgi:hypothetical protein
MTTPSQAESDTGARAKPGQTPGLTGMAIDETDHSRDGLLLHGWDQADEVTAFIGRKVMDDWVAGDGGGARRPSLFRDQYTALGKRNLAAIDRVVRTKYDRGPGFNRQHPFVEVLLADIVESGEVLDTSLLAVRGGGLAPPRIL